MFAKNLKYLRNRIGMEQSELAQKLGKKSTSSISEWENGKYTPKMKTLNDIAKIFNVNIDELMSVDLQNAPVEKKMEMYDAKKIPVVSKISAGVPLYAEENIIEYAYIPSFLNKKLGQLFYLKVDGDSMNKEFNEGDLVLVEKDAVVENGQIGIVQVNGYNATVKRVKYDDDSIILIPESTNDVHLPQIYSKTDDVKIIGKVISVQKFY
ncbi:LexA family protein [Macrococcus armenti]|uniref:LexA family protein n=1 Tax=Macrococcus armenti TaxID=2875764 RepID=UPI001CCD2B76|nr:XRE family transcriptional regulator [Macrococcus armenti]UBH16366.1 XRE family transcriptional regulator [Macrococcus armenti]UBH18722.1 XRE family transcriptional regulator [Macrococcus armenti]UBH20994.1 XRE family transcriptional regulator [Macrococcus armenti]